MFTNFSSPALIGALLLSMACTAVPTAPSVPELTPGAAAAFDDVSAMGLDWSEGDLLALPDSAASIPAFTEPLGIASKFTTAGFHFKEHRTNGRDVYRDPTDSITVKVDAAQGYWKLIRREPTTLTGRALSESEVDLRARHLVDSFGIPDEQLGEIVDSPLVSEDQNRVRTILGHTIYIPRVVNGYRVLGSFVKATYDGAGEVVQTEVRWPAFALAKGAGLANPEEVSRRFAEDLEVPFSLPTERPRLEGEVAYMLNSEGLYEPVVRLWAFDPVESSMPTLMEYGLLSHSMRSPVVGESPIDQ